MKDILVLANFRIYESQKKAILKLKNKYGGEAKAYRAIIEKGLKVELNSKSKKN